MFGPFGTATPDPPEDPPEPRVAFTKPKDPEPDPDLTKILKWREKKLVDAGLPLGEASVLAAARLEMGYVDTELIKSMFRKGCPPDQIVKILV